MLCFCKKIVYKCNFCLRFILFLNQNAYFCDINTNIESQNNDERRVISVLFFVVKSK